MPCDSYVSSPKQTIKQRIEEIREVVAKLSQGLATGRIKVKVGPQGAVGFIGFEDRRGVTDGCAYRRLMVDGTALAKAKIAQAEMLAGRAVDKRVVASGVHLHGDNWHGSHKK